MFQADFRELDNRSARPREPAGRKQIAYNVRAIYLIAPTGHVTQKDLMNAALPHCQVIPLPDHQVSFQIHGQERTRWHYGKQYPRPFFYPFNGPSGQTLTRMGHPGAPNHDHHRSIWFAHHKLLGIDFWGDSTESRIVQTEWLAYEDSNEEARMAVRLKWYDGHDPAELVTQDMIACVRPGDQDSANASFAETLLEIQTSFTPQAESIEFQQTNFGFLAVRVARNISAYFGGGSLTNSEGAEGEPAIFAKPARWMDYSGPAQAESGFEGVTYFDHSTNPNQATHWHVRQDGWMGAAPCLQEPLTATKENPITLRYLLHAHHGKLDADRAEQIYQAFEKSPARKIVKSERGNTAWEIQRT
jgi:hypothetical protein